jgi:hypothetical protein
LVQALATEVALGLAVLDALQRSAGCAQIKESEPLGPGLVDVVVGVVVLCVGVAESSMCLWRVTARASVRPHMVGVLETNADGEVDVEEM